MKLLRSQSTLYFNPKAAIISCSRCSDGSMWLPFW